MVELTLQVTMHKNHHVTQQAEPRHTLQSADQARHHIRT